MAAAIPTRSLEERSKTCNTKKETKTVPHDLEFEERIFQPTAFLKSGAKQGLREPDRQCDAPGALPTST
jgi:hypothetical protein